MDKSEVIEEIKKHLGARNGITAATLVANVTNNLFPRECELRKLRYCISQLRHEGHGICGTPESGYFMAENTDELNDTCEFLLSRAESSWQQVAAMKRVSVPTLRGQLTLCQQRR